MSIPWEKLLISAAVGFGVLSLFKPKFLSANQAQFFGLTGPQVQTSADVKTSTCTPANYYGNGAPATYCNPECASGTDCADARAEYCRLYAPGGVCLTPYGSPAADQGLPGQGPVVGGGFGDIVNAFGWGAAQQSAGYGYGQSPYGYGYPPQTGYGYGYPQTGYGYGYPQTGYGYGYPQTGYGYNPYAYNPYQSYNPYAYRPPIRRAYAVTGYDKSSGHFLYG